MSLPRRHIILSPRQLVTLTVLSLTIFAKADAIERGEMAVTKSPHARLRPASMDEASWTEGFWADRFHRSRTSTIPAVEQGLLNPDNSEQLDVLLIAAGLKPGDRKGKGTNWTDGDCYKWIEAMARQYTVTGAPGVNAEDGPVGPGDCTRPITGRVSFDQLLE